MKNSTLKITPLVPEPESIMNPIDLAITNRSLLAELREAMPIDQTVWVNQQGVRTAAEGATPAAVHDLADRLRGITGGLQNTKMSTFWGICTGNGNIVFEIEVEHPQVKSAKLGWRVEARSDDVAVARVVRFAQDVRIDFGSLTDMMVTLDNPVLLFEHIEAKAAKPVDAVLKAYGFEIGWKSSPDSSTACFSTLPLILTSERN